MTDQFHWVETTGGPHVFGAVEVLVGWCGIDGWRGNEPGDDSHYARACRVKGWFGKVAGFDGDVVALSGDVGPIAWFANADGLGGLLVQWLGCDSEDAVLAVVRNYWNTPASSRRVKEVLEFETGPSGVLSYFDASLRWDEAISERETFAVPPGRYRLLASYVETEDCVVLLREVERVSS